MNPLSLVIIVKDEADLLPGFLAHHGDLAGEVVVVDTGSSDGTPDLAHAAGAQVIKREWGDDFSAARNTGLAAARGEWILILDADELIDPGDFGALHRLLEAGEPRVMIQETINYCRDPAHLEWRPVSGRYPLREAGQTGYFSARRAGLFPRRDDLRFSGRIHESLLPAAQTAGLPVVEVPIPVHHYGYVRSPEIDRRRKERYLRLAALKRADNPADWATLLELATAHLETGAVRPAIGLLEQLAQGPEGLRPVVRGLFLLGRIRREEGDLAEAGRLLEAAVAQDPGFLFGWLELIRCRAVAGRWTETGELLARARQKFGAADPLLAKENLRYLVKTGQLPAAARQAEQLRLQYPQWGELAAFAALLGRLDTRGKSGGET